MSNDNEVHLSCLTCDGETRRKELENQRKLWGAMWTATEEQLAKLLGLLHSRFRVCELSDRLERMFYSRVVRRGPSIDPYHKLGMVTVFVSLLRRLEAREAEAQAVCRRAMHESGHPVDTGTLIQIIEWVYSEPLFDELWEPAGKK